MPRLPCSAVDRNIGKRIRARRESLGISQAKLAAHLDISFQQIQKYEAGTNKIAASRLVEISYQLQMPVVWFFECME